jgi:mono/diheme cytochrome c family protein/plastocyanin
MSRYSELSARLILIALALMLVLAVGLGKWLEASAPNQRVIEIRARMPENGGWTPSDLTARVGETLHLRLTSDDVMHGFAIGGDSLRILPAAVDVEPGKTSEVTLTFDQPGKYTYYCTRWCGLNHWRMRGVIEVSGPLAETTESTPPLYLTLGLDIDAPHPAEVVPEARPSAGRGEVLRTEIPAKYRTQNYYRSHSPAQIWSDLRSEPSLSGLSAQDVWDLVAFIWKTNTTPQSQEEGQALFAANCAACHGESGAGDGVMANNLAENGDDAGTGGDPNLPSQKTTRPADFTQAKTMLGASSALLQGKILRGGMGTGMPYWGPIFTEEQTWAIVDYLWTFQFQPKEVEP